MEYKDFPKLYSPFVRHEVDSYHVVANEIDPGQSWFLDDGVLAVDKIDGTKIGLLFENGELSKVYNRMNEKRLLHKSASKWATACLEGISTAIPKDWCKEFEDGKYYYGELVGPIINANRHKLDKHIWVPFDYLKKHCAWKSWSENKYPKDFESIKNWFKNLPSLFSMRMGKKDILTEGLAFYHPDGRVCKLRRDMFIEFWNGTWNTSIEELRKHHFMV